MRFLAAAIGGTHDTHKLHRLRTHPGNQGRKARAFHDGCNVLPTLMARCRPRLGAKHPEQTASVAPKAWSSGSPCNLKFEFLIKAWRVAAMRPGGALGADAGEWASSPRRDAAAAVSPRR